MGDERGLAVGSRTRRPLRTRRPQGATLRGPLSVRDGFSLIELIVAIGILSIMMLLVGQIFDLTVESTGQATALIEINQSLRMLENNLREDLEGVIPEDSMLAIQGNFVPAYWTLAQKEGDADGRSNNGYPHEPDPEREDLYGANLTLLDGDEDINDSGIMPPYKMQRPRADILMFFTDRKTTSSIFPAVSSTAGSMVVYGHAALGELMPDGEWNPTAEPRPPSPNDVAANWHLARRAIALVEDSRTALFKKGIYGAPTTPTTGFPPRPAVPIIDAERDFIVRHDSVTDILGCQLFTNRLVAPKPECRTLSQLPERFDIIEQGWMARSRMDLTPPPAQAYRLGHYFLPNCASFKVEWGLSVDAGPNKKFLIWVDPADVQNSVVDALISAGAGFIPGAPPDPNNPMQPFEPSTGPADVRRFDPTVTELPPPPAHDWTIGTTHMFLSADYDGSGGASAPDPYFPKALRITVDMFDRAGKLVRPIRHVMVIPIGPPN